jgi:putative transposase
VARAHGKAARKRKDFLHKPLRSIARTCDAVVIEDLDMHGLARALNFGKSVGDNVRGMSVSTPGYKLGDQGERLAAIARSFPSSKTCCRCGHVKDTLGLAERSCVCERCGHVLDRDWNAA